MSRELESILIKPGSLEEEKYSKKHHIEYLKLDNGVTLLGIPCRKDSTFWASIRWNFSEGAYGNPPGAAHLDEHFINKKVRPLAEHNLLSIRAATSQTDTFNELSGSANPGTKDYGIWPVLKEIRTALESPSKNSSDVENEIETERQVIKAEVQRDQSNHDFQVGNNWRRTVFSRKNPLYDFPTVPGSIKEIDNLTLSTLREVENRIFISKNLLITVYSEGDLTITKDIIHILGELYSDFPGTEKAKNVLDQSLLEKINPLFKPGNIYEYDHKLNNGIVTTEFVWIFKDKLSSKKSHTLSLLSDIVSTELFMYSRKRGWGYHTDASVTRDTDNIEYLTLRVDEKKSHKNNLTEGVNEVLNSLKILTKNAIKLEHRRQEAVPIDVSNRFFWVVRGIKKYGAMIDADKFREDRLGVTSQDLDKLLDELLSLKPATIITGDLN